MKRLYTKAAKTLVVVVFLVCALLVAFSISWMVTGVGNGMDIQDVLSVDGGIPYRQSRGFADDVYDSVENQRNIADWQTKFYKDGKYDGNQTVDITDLESGISSSKKSKNYEYRLDDLAKFYHSEGYYYLRYLVNEGQSDLVMDLSDEEDEDAYDSETSSGERASTSVKDDKNVYGSKAEVVGEYTLTQEELYNYDENGASGSPDKTVTFKRYRNYYNVLYNNGIAIEKKYIQTVSGSTLAEYAQKNLNTVSIYDSYQALLDAADEISGLDTWQEDGDALNGSTVKVFVRSLDGSYIYTNEPRWKNKTLKSIYKEYYPTQNKSEENDLGSNFYGYLYSSSGLKGIDEPYKDEETITDSNDTETEYLTQASSKYLLSRGTQARTQWKNTQLSDQGNYEFLIAVDTSNTSDNSLSTMESIYDWFWESCPPRPIWGWAVAGMIGMVITLILAILQTGHRAEDQKIYSASIDRFPIELMMLMDLILLLVILAASFSIFAADYRVSGYSSGYTLEECKAQHLGIMGAICGGVVSGSAWLLWAVKRYVRRIKARNIGGSIFAWLFREMHKFMRLAYDSRKENEKLILKFILFVLVHLFFVGLAGAILARGGLPMTCVIILLILLFDAWVLSRLLRNTRGSEELKQGMRAVAGGDLDHQIDTQNMSGTNREMGEELNRVRDGLKAAVETEMKSERLKTDLITNVSHDIKTPLTSIINYVDILKREHIEDEKIAGYIEILDKKSQRLKQLTEDLVEASKISSGNITLDMQEINLKQLIKQTNGEIEEKFEARGLELICELPEESLMIRADGRRMYRVLENLYNNTAKYSMPNSRVYVNGRHENGKVIFTMKNMSEHPLNFKADELLQRFVRGDVSRSTEGSGLGLEIARNLTVMQHGDFKLYLDGDLFKVTITFDEAVHETDTQEV